MSNSEFTWYDTEELCSTSSTSYIIGSVIDNQRTEAFVLLEFISFLHFFIGRNNLSSALELPRTFEAFPGVSLQLNLF